MGEWENVAKNWRDFHGFVYRITHKETGNYYIGCKTLYSKDKKKISNWEKYYGSSRNLKYHLKLYGKKAFKREIISYHKTQSDMKLTELMEQLVNDVLNDPKSYNGIIHVRLGSRKLPEPKAPKGFK